MDMFDVWNPVCIHRRAGQFQVSNSGYWDDGPRSVRDAGSHRVSARDTDREAVTIKVS